MVTLRFPEKRAADAGDVAPTLDDEYERRSRPLLLDEGGTLRRFAGCVARYRNAA
jgi:hypothetical protein